MKKLLLATTLLGLTLNAATVATVDGQAIDERDLAQVMQQITRGQYAQLPDASKVQVKKVALEQVIGQLLIQNEAQKSGISKTEIYKKALQDTLTRIEPQLRAEVWLKKEFEKISATPKEVKAFYDKNQAKFNIPKQVHARHILVKKDDKALAQKLIKEMKTLKGASLQARFMELAKKHSTGPSGANGGDLGFFPEGAMVPEFNKAVFAMKKGTITAQPVLTKFGYHVIYLEAVKGGESKNYNELKSQVEQGLKAEKFQKQLKAQVETLKTKAKISYK